MTAHGSIDQITDVVVAQQTLRQIPSDPAMSFGNPR